MNQGGLVLYGRRWCHLCEQMHSALEPLLAEFNMPLTVIDIDTDPALTALYDERVPVLTYHGAELCHYRLDVEQVRAVLV